MQFVILVTSFIMDRQGAYSAYQFCNALLQKGQTINQVFFYGSGVYMAHSSAEESAVLVSLWQQLAQHYGIKLYVCINAAARRGLCDRHADADFLPLAPGFVLTGLAELIKGCSECDRLITFN